MATSALCVSFALVVTMMVSVRGDIEQDYECDGKSGVCTHVNELQRDYHQQQIHDRRPHVRKCTEFDSYGDLR